MVDLEEIDAIHCVVIGDSLCGKEMMLKKYAAYTGVPYDVTNGQLITAFNGRKCIFVDSATDHNKEVPHVFLLCVSVAQQAGVEETVKMILNTIIDRIRGIPFVLVGTQIEKRLLNGIDHNERDENYMPMPLNRAESFAKQIGASKYLECSEVTGEGVEEVFEEAFEIGYAQAIKQRKPPHRRKSLLEAAKTKRTSCISQ